MFEQLLPKQVDAAEFILRQKTVGVFLEQGTGKTWVTAGVIERLMPQDPEILLVVLLTNLETTWVRMLEKIEGLTVYRTWPEFKAAHGPKALLMHYESIPRLKNNYKQQMTKHQWTIVVADESQRIKSRGTKQSRFMGLIKNAEYRLALSGTPFDDLDSDPQELWAQARFFAPQVFGTRWAEYETQYLKPSGYMGYGRTFKSRGIREHVLNMIKPYCMRLLKTEVLDLPSLRYHFVPVTLFGQQARVYDEMAKKMITTVKGKKIITGLTITKLVKLQQICGGFIRDNDGIDIPLGRAKVRKLKQLVAKVDFPVVVFTKYRSEVAEVVLGLSGGNCRISTITGKNRKTRTQTIDDFQSGKIDVLVVQVKAGGAGVDLFRANTAIFYSCTHSFIDFDQAVCRLHRKGQKRAVEIFLLYAKNTVDKLIYDSLLCKRSLSGSILRKFKVQLRSERRRPIMAKPDKKTASKKSTKPVEKPAPEKAPKNDSPKYGITELAEAMGVEPASARVKLRAAGIEKVGGRYGWDTKAELQEVVSKLGKGAAKKSSKKAKDDDDDEDEDLDD